LIFIPPPVNRGLAGKHFYAICIKEGLRGWLKGSGLSLDSTAMTVDNRQFLTHHALAYFSQAAVPDITVTYNLS
jgi:hypothetical protein